MHGGPGGIGIKNMKLNIESNELGNPHMTSVVFTICSSNDKIDVLSARDQASFYKTVTN